MNGSQCLRAVPGTGREFGTGYRFWVLCLAVFCLLSFSGCSPEWKRKFIRKRKTEKTQQAILVLQPDARAVHAVPDRYREHFAFWKSWHGELLSSFGQIEKRDKRYLEGVISELQAMQELLTGPAAQRVKEILIELRGMRQSWDPSPGFWAPPVKDRSGLQRFQREINKKFHYSKIKSVLVKEPSEESTP